MDKSFQFSITLSEGQRLYDSIDELNTTFNLTLSKDQFVDGVATMLNGYVTLHAVDNDGHIVYIFTDPNEYARFLGPEEMDNPVLIRTGESLPVLFEEDYQVFNDAVVREKVEYSPVTAPFLRRVKGLLADNGLANYPILGKTGKRLEGLIVQYKGEPSVVNGKGKYSVLLSVPNDLGYEVIILNFG